jgi:CRP/FNR family transcriptional regulator, cyclic AMP receptor protein
MAPRDQKLQLLGRVPLFAGCASRDLEEIGKLADEVDVPAGQTLMTEGATAQEFFVVIDGSLRVERGGAEIAKLGPGDFVGEIGLVDGRPRTATVTAESASRLFVIGHREFHSLLEAHPGIQIEILQALAQRVRQLLPEGIH